MPFGEPPRQPVSHDPADSDITLRISALDQSSPRLTAIRPRLGIRVWTIAATSLLVVAVLVGLLLRATNDPRGAIGTLLQIPTPTPEPTMLPGANALYFANVVPWGTLTIDSRHFSVNDLRTYEFNGITLTRGRHQLVYQARYFPTVRCTLTVPQAKADTCPIDTTSGATARNLATEGGRTIDLGARVGNLSAEQHDALLTTINTALQAQKLTADIAAGDRYVDAQGSVVTASEPLTLTLTLSNHPTIYDHSVDGCDSLCPDTSGVLPGLSIDGNWPLQAALYAQWTLTTASGQSLGTVDYQHGAAFKTPGGNTDTFLTPLAVTLTASGWQVSGLDGLTTQAAINAQENTVTVAISQQVGNGGFAMGQRFIGVGSNPLQGCFVLVYPIEAPGSVTIVVRFGGAFVVNDDGQTIYMRMLHANADEVNVMNTLTQQNIQQISF